MRADTLTSSQHSAVTQGRDAELGVHPTSIAPVPAGSPPAVAVSPPPRTKRTQRKAATRASERIKQQADPAPACCYIKKARKNRRKATGRIQAEMDSEEELLIESALDGTLLIIIHTMLRWGHGNYQNARELKLSAALMERGLAMNLSEIVELWKKT